MWHHRIAVRQVHFLSELAVLDQKIFYGSSKTPEATAQKNKNHSKLGSLAPDKRGNELDTRSYPQHPTKND